MRVSRGVIYLAAAEGEWLAVPSEFAALYMTYLARRITHLNQLELVSDSIPAATASTYFQFDGLLEPESRYGGMEFSHYLAFLILDDFLPENILDIPPERILQFRRQHADERRNFMRAISEAGARISKCEDSAVIQGLIRDLRVDIDRAVAEYRSSARMLNVKSWTGMKSFSVPIAASLFAKLGEFEPGAASFLFSSGVALGTVLGHKRLRQTQKELARKSDFSYLLQAKKTFAGRGALAGNMAYAMTELVVD